MKFGFLALFIVVLCSCKVDKATPYNSLQNTKWNWVSTTQDTSFYEDTASSSTSQFLNFIDYKNMEWKRNDSVFYYGIFEHHSQVSVLTGAYELVMKLDGVQTDYVIDRLVDTLWLREDIASGSKTYKYLKMN